MGIKKLSRRVRKLLNRQTLADLLHENVKAWKKDQGDSTLRLDYPLNSTSVVWDVGGYHGDFAHDIHQRYGCAVTIFEPLPQYYEQCVERFRGNEKIKCFNYGLSDVEGVFDISEDTDGSSFIKLSTTTSRTQAQLRPVDLVHSELGSPVIDLLKINIEGGEFQVLPALQASGIIDSIQFLQVQFHTFVDDAVARRNQIRTNLQKTHQEMWNYEFIWESWSKKS